MGAQNTLYEHKAQLTNITSMLETKASQEEMTVLKRICLSLPTKDDITEMNK
jgi:hypothetical protein